VLAFGVREARRESDTARGIGFGFEYLKNDGRAPSVVAPFADLLGVSTRADFADLRRRDGR